MSVQDKFCGIDHYYVKLRSQAQETGIDWYSNKDVFKLKDCKCYANPNEGKFGSIRVSASTSTPAQ